MASTDAQVSLNNTASGSGTTVDFATAKRNVSAICSASGTVSDGFVYVEASHDSTNWVVLHTFRLRDSGSRHFELSGGAYRYFRASLAKGATGGGRVTVTFMEAD